MRWAIHAWICGRPVQIRGNFDRHQDAQRFHIKSNPYFRVDDTWVGPDHNHDDVYTDIMWLFRKVGV